MKEELDTYGAPMTRICYFDVETTGLDPYEDRIVEIAWLSAAEGEDGDEYETLVDPGVPIPPESTEVHGITDEMVEGAPSFEEIAEAVEIAVADAVLVGYNIRRFDTIILDAELRRAGRPGLPRDSNGEFAVAEVDLYEVWRRSEPRNLETAVKRFLADDAFDQDHRAASDVAPLPFLLDGMAGAFGLHEETTDGVLESLMALSRPEWEVDRSGKFRREDDGTVVFNFGKHQGEPVKRNVGYLRWMLSADFPPDTEGWCRFFLDHLG